jgi:hypothetical protein
LAGHLGLRTDGISDDVLYKRLEHLERHKYDIGDVKANDDTYSWFEPEFRLSRFIRELNPTTGLEFDADWIQGGYGVDQASWEQNGYFVPRQGANWWAEVPGLQKLVAEEMAMYRHHNRQEDTSTWALNDCIYSVTQQLMRQDVSSYALHVGVRPDKCWRLCSYPSHAKCVPKCRAVESMSVDINIHKFYLEGRGRSMVMSHSALVSEDDRGGLVMARAVYRSSREWAAQLEKKGLELTGPVHHLTPEYLPLDMLKLLNCGLRKVEAAFGDTIFHRPAVPYGTSGKVNGTMVWASPCYVAVQDDYETLEFPESITWSELSAAHRDMISPKNGPTGEPLTQGVIRCAFPASVSLTGLGPLSEALVGRQRWFASDVIDQRNQLFDPKHSQRFIDDWRAVAAKKALEAFANAELIERHVFGDNSYYYQKEVAARDND